MPFDRCPVCEQSRWRREAGVWKVSLGCSTFSMCSEGKASVQQGNSEHWV